MKIINTKYKKKIETRMLKCMLTPAEQTMLSDQLVHAIKDKNEYTEVKKMVVSDFRTRLQEKEEFIQKSTAAILEGNEERDVECEVKFHKPKEGEKTIVRKDTGEEWVESMTAEELFEEEK